MTCKYKVKIKDIQYNYKVQMTDIQSKYKFKIFCTGYDDTEIKEKINTMYEAWPKVSGEGETVSLSNTVTAPVTIDLKGNTSQEGTPTPETPQDIHVVSGNNSINVCGKNLFDKSAIVNTSMYAGSVGQVVSIGANTNTFRYPIFKKTSDSITISASDTNATTRVLLLDKNNKILSTTAYTTLPRTIDTSSCEFIAIFFDNTTITINDNIQIEKGSTATTFEAYKGATYPVNLGDIELCKIGTYQDYIYKEGKKWYKYGAINKVILDGTTNSFSDRYTTNTANKYRFVIFNTGCANIPTTTIGPVLSDKFEPKTAVNTYNAVQGIALNDANNRLIIYCNDIETYTKEQANTWLESNNVIVYYALATPTTTEITDITLISQLEALKEAEGYTGQTNISQTNSDKPFIITATTLKDLSNL